MRKWLQMRPLAMFVPPEIVVDGISLIKDRTLEEIIDMCQDRTTSRSIDHLPSMEAYGGFGAFAEHMTSELKVATVLGQFFLWDKVERLATPGVTNVAHDCGITAGEGYWIVPSLSSVIDADSFNWNQWQQGSIENKLWAHGLSQFSLWASLAHEEVVSSESEDKIGIWTSLVYSQALGYTPWAHYGQGVWAHLSFMLPVDAASGDNPRGDKTRRLMLARAPIFALAIKFSHDLEKITGGEGFSTCYANGDIELQRFNPYIEVNPCSPSVSWRKRAFFQPNAIGEIGATKRELERLAAPSTPTKTGGFSQEFARHRLISNTYAMKVQEAGSSIPFAHEKEYPKYPGYVMEEHLAPSTMFLDIDKMIGKYKQEWIANPESEVLPSLSRPKTSHLTTYDQNALEKEWIGWGNQMFRNVILTVFPEFALTCIDSDVPTIPSVLRGLLPMSTTGVTGILAAMAAGWGPPTYLEEPTIKANAQVLVFYDLCFASRGKSKKGSYITTDEFGAQLDTLRSTDSGPRKGSTPKIQFHCPDGESGYHIPIATMIEEATRLTHDREKAVGRGAMEYDTCIFATRLHDLADWDEKKQVSVVKSNAQTLIHTTLERLEAVRRAGSSVVILISVASWFQPTRNTNMLGVITTFIRAAMKRNLIVVPADFAFWGDHCVGSSGAPANKYRTVVALPALASAAVDISWTLHRVMSATNAAKTLGMLYKKTMYPPDEDAKVKAEKILQTKVWDDSLTYSTAPPAMATGADSSGQSHDVEMTDAAPTATPPAQAAAPSVAKTPARQAEPKGPAPKVVSPPKRPISPPKAPPAKAKGPIDIRNVPKAPVPSVPAKGGTPAKSPDPGSTATKGAPPARAPNIRTSGGSSPIPEPADPPKAPRWGGPLPKSVLTPPGKDESNFPRLASPEASRKAAAAAKKKTEELKKPTGTERKDVPTLPTVEEKDDDDMDVDAGIDEVSFARLNWHNKPAVPTDPATMARPVGPRGVDVNVDDLVKTPDRTGDDAPGVGPQPDASMEVGGSTGSGGPPTKEDLSEFDEVDPDAHTSTGDTGVSVEGYTITPDGEYYDPDSQETFQTLEAWKAQRRSSRHRVVRASATESKDPVHGGLEEPEERNPNYYGDDTEPKRGSIPLDEAFTRPDRFVLHHIAAREKNFEPIVASFANKARNSDQVSREQGDQSRTLNAAIPNDRHGVREMAKRATLVDWAHAYADKCTVHGPKQFQYVHFGKEATDRTEADEWTKVMETIVPPEYPPEIRDQIDSKFVTRKGESGDHHTGIFGKAKQPLGNSNSYPNRARCDAMVHDGTRLGMVDSRNGEVIPMDDVFWTAEYMNAYDLNSQLSAVRAGLDMALATAWRMGHVHPHMAGAVAGLQKIRTFYDCLHAAHRKTRLGSLPFHQIVGELDRVDDRGNKLEPNIPDTWRTTALRGEYPDCLAQSVAQVFRSMCGPLAMSGSREDRAVIIRRDESAFTRGDKIMGIPWPAYRRPTAREIKEAKEKAEKEGHNASEDVDMSEPRDKPVVAGGESAGTTATGASNDKEDGPASPVTQAPDAPAETAHPPADALPSQVEARSTLLGVHDTAGPFAAPRDLHTGQFIYVDCTEEERAMLPATIGSQFEAERALAELRTVCRVVSDPRDSEEYTYWETSTHDTLAYAFYSVPDQYRNVPAVKSASRIFDQIPDGQLVRPDKPEPAVLRLSAVKGTDETRRNLERLKEESIKKNVVILGARRGEDIAPRIGNTITILCSKIEDIARFLEMGVRSRAGPILPTKSDPDLMIQAIVPAPEELLDYFADEIRQKVKGRASASSHYYRRACAEIRDALRGTAVQPGNAGAVKDPELEASSASGQGNVTSVVQLKKFLSHYFGTSVESEEAFSSYLLSSFLEDGVGMFEIIITVIRDKERRLLPGSARIAAVRSLEIGSDTDYRAFRERYQYTLYESPVCLPITSKGVPKTLYKVVPLRMYRLYVERGAIIRGGRALIELLPSRPDEYQSLRDHGECPNDTVDRITDSNVTELHTSGASTKERSPICGHGHRCALLLHGEWGHAYYSPGYLCIARKHRDRVLEVCLLQGGLLHHLPEALVLSAQLPQRRE